MAEKGSDAQLGDEALDVAWQWARLEEARGRAEDRRTDQQLAKEDDA